MGGHRMYNEKNEMKKVNFGDLPVNWDEEEFAEDLTLDDQADCHSLDANSNSTRAIDQKFNKKS